LDHRWTSTGGLLEMDHAGRRPASAAPPGWFNRCSARRGGVLARQLRRGALLLLLLSVQPRLTSPGALEVVADVEAQATEPLGLDLDPVPVLEAAQAAMVRARRDDVAGLERVD